MAIYKWLVPLLLASIGSQSANSPQVFETGTIKFPRSGLVAIHGAVKQGEYPHLVFHSVPSNTLLLNANVGSGSDWQEYRDKEDPNHVLMEIRFVVLHRAGLPDPLIVALAKMPGGSDCRFRTALFGETDGRIVELTPDLPDHWTRGQVLLSDSSPPHPTRLTVLSERYQSNDVHVNGPSRMAVFVYTYSSQENKFMETKQADTKVNTLHAAGEDLIALFGEFGRC